MSLLHFYRGPLTEFDRLCDDAPVSRFRPSVSAYVGQHLDAIRPRMDVHASEDTNTVTATFELPGVTSDEVTVNVHQNRLTVTGEARRSHSHEEGGYSVRERSHGGFSRTLQLPFATKPDDVKAKMENGVLTVTFPKTTPEQQAQRIAIQ